MAYQQESTGHLMKLAGRLKVIAYVATGLAIFSYAGLQTAVSGFGVFAALFYLTAFAAVVSSVGAVVGQLLLAARRDAPALLGEVSSPASQDWYQ